MRSRILVSLLTVGTLVLGNPIIPVLAGQIDGLSYLVAATQLKANNANDCGFLETEECDPPPPPPPPPPKKPPGKKIAPIATDTTFNTDFVFAR
jgi:hypothetical protein